jgi:6-methylsalicylate decarboxylase
MGRIDTHSHLIPPDYRDALRKAGIDDAGGRALPDWTPDLALEAMAELDVATGILSVSAPGTTFLSAAADAAALARDLNEYTTGVVAERPDRFGFFATIPMPHVEEAVSEVVRVAARHPVAETAAKHCHG